MQSREKTAELVSRIKAKSEEFATTDEAYLTYLSGMKKFHRYSFSNQILILLQYPDASAVNSYKRWQAIGRQVRKGEKGINIIAPRVAKGKKEGEDDRLYFAAASVFAYEQTDVIEGFENPWAPMEIPRLEGDGGAEYIDRLIQLISAEGVTFRWFDEDTSYNGLFRSEGVEIEVWSGLSPLHQLSTLVHEIAHWQHWRLDKDCRSFIDRRVAEFVAESSSYAVLSALGLDTAAKSFSYAGFYNIVGKDEKLVSDTMKQIVNIVHSILDMLEAPLVPAASTEEEVAA